MLNPKKQTNLKFEISSLMKKGELLLSSKWQDMLCGVLKGLGLVSNQGL